MNDYDYFKPRSLDEAWDFYEKFPGARYIAGGTDLMVRIKNRDIEPRVLISLRSVPGLDGVHTGEHTRIGAMTSITDLLNHTELSRIFPLLSQAAQRIGSAQVRNVGTVGGNLCNCSPCADTALALLALEARVVLKRPQGSREVPLDEFFLGPGQGCLTPDEILTDILVDPPAPGARHIFMKKGRVKMDLSLASLAVYLEMDGSTCKKARVAAGSVAPVPLRLKKVEQLLENAAITSERIDEAQTIAMESISPITDIRAGAAFRRELTGIYLKRSLKKLTLPG